MSAGHLICQSKLPSSWKDADYRHHYAVASVEQKLCWQIKVMRKNRGWSQRELALRSGVSVKTISRYEGGRNDANEEIKLSTLQKIARAFDVAMCIELIPFSSLQRERGHLDERALDIASYPG